MLYKERSGALRQGEVSQPREATSSPPRHFVCLLSVAGFSAGMSLIPPSNKAMKGTKLGCKWPCSLRRLLFFFPNGTTGAWGRGRDVFEKGCHLQRDLQSLFLPNSPEIMESVLGGGIIINLNHLELSCQVPDGAGAARGEGRTGPCGPHMPSWPHRLGQAWSPCPWPPSCWGLLAPGCHPTQLPSCSPSGAFVSSTCRLIS